jgi:UDP-2,3-diacylglucosamine hydrolase
MGAIVFISDLHLHPDIQRINARFDAFLDWAAIHAKTIYILGDFFHVWAGDDTLTAWSEAIADRLAWLTAQGVTIYYMPGNRDFLLGSAFCLRATMIRIPDPSLIQLGNTRVLLTHGDQFCTADKAHQRLRRLTRNCLFINLFLMLPRATRINLVRRVRQYSATSHAKTETFIMDVVPDTLIRHMNRLKVNTVIHGHTHKPGLTAHRYDSFTYHQYVLSDWDDNPWLLVYNESNGLKFECFLWQEEVNNG